MNTFAGKKLLLIAPVFFDYYIDIINECELIGLQVDYVCDTCSNTNISKAIGRMNKELLRNRMKHYFDTRIIPMLTGKHYDYVLLIAGMTYALLPEMIQHIRYMNPTAFFALYQWDSEKNLPNIVKIHSFFDAIYSFDRRDCINCDKYTFLPLFFTRSYEIIGKHNDFAPQYDCSYVGTAHPKKISDIYSITQAVKECLPRQYIYQYMPSKLKYLYHKLTSPEYADVKLRDLEPEKLLKDQVIQVITASFCVLDAQQSGQTGLTIRCVEALGAKKKLLTTNADIRNYDFFNETNILVFDGSIDKNAAFFTQPYEELPNEIYEKYSLRCWLRTLLG